MRAQTGREVTLPAILIHNESRPFPLLIGQGKRVLRQFGLQFPLGIDFRGLQQQFAVAAYFHPAAHWQVGFAIEPEFTLHEVARVEPEYRRGGAWQYLAAWDVRRGYGTGRCEAKTGIAPCGRLGEQVLAVEP